MCESESAVFPPNENIIYFHKTIQHLTNNQDGFREHKNCYFQDNTNIESINNIVCLDKDETVMGRAFSEFDKTILRQIMKRPFENRGGKKFRNRKNTRKKNSKFNPSGNGQTGHLACHFCS